MPRTLIVTNDFPPRIGGIESFVSDVCTLLNQDVVVYASGPPSAWATDAERGYPVVRAGPLLLPTRQVAAELTDLALRYGVTRAIFGAAAPLGLLAPHLRRTGVHNIVGLTHGHETWWATLPGARALLHRIGESCDHLTVVSDYTERRISTVLSPRACARVLRLAPPVDTTVFRPARRQDDGAPARAVAVGRLVAQKGFSTLLRAWRLVVNRLAGSGPAPELTLVGDGPQRPRLERLVQTLGLSGRVRFSGALPRAGVVAELQRSDAFALPVRTRLAGLNPEGLGLAAVEAAACGLPVVVGRSGGAPETVLDGKTGFVVPPDDHRVLAARLVELLADPVRGKAMGAAGRRFVAEQFSVARARLTLRQALDL